MTDMDETALEMYRLMVCPANYDPRRHVSVRNHKFTKIHDQDGLRIFAFSSHSKRFLILDTINGSIESIDRNVVGVRTVFATVEGAALEEMEQGI